MRAPRIIGDRGAATIGTPDIRSVEKVVLHRAARPGALVAALRTFLEDEEAIAGFAPVEGGG